MSGQRPIDLHRSTWISYFIRKEFTEKAFNEDRVSDNKREKVPGYSLICLLEEMKLNKLIIFNVYMLGLISVLSFNNTDLMEWYLEKGYSIHT